MIRIIPAELSDLPNIYQLFEEAIAFIQQRGYIGWKEYDKRKLQEDIDEKLLYKVVEDDTIAGIFSICYSDAVIWRRMEDGRAVYLHRLVTNRNVQGLKLFDIVLQWAIEHAQCIGREFLRMDTWAENEKIIAYYKQYGFMFVENYTTPDAAALPKQHRNLHVALLEYKIPTAIRNSQNEFLIHVVKTIRVRFTIVADKTEDDFGTYKIGCETRTPNEILHHMYDLAQKSSMMIKAGHFNVASHTLMRFSDEYVRFLNVISELENLLNTTYIDKVSSKKLLQGPLLDMATHIGQLAMLKGLYGNKIPPISYFDLNI